MSHRKWITFVQQCLLRRIGGDEFQDLADYMNEKYSSGGRAIARIILGCRHSFCPQEDPLVPLYLHAIVALGLASVADILFMLVDLWNNIEYRKLEAGRPGSISTPDVSIVLDLATTVSSTDDKQSPLQTRQSLMLSSRWLSALITLASGTENQLPVITLVEAVGFLLTALASSPHGITILSKVESTEPRKSVEKAFSDCQSLIGNLSVQLHNRIDTVQKHYGLSHYSNDKALDPLTGKSPQIDPLQFESTVTDRVAEYARASLFVYFNAALCRSVLADDHRLIAFLNARYAGNFHSMFTDLVISPFDLIIGADVRKESPQLIKIYRSFLTSKVPLLLSLIVSTSLEPLSSEECLSEAFRHIDMTMSPASNTDLVKAKSFLHGLRREFVSACILHKLCSVESATSLLGSQISQSSLPRGPCQKDEILQQMKSNHSRLDQLLTELGGMQGNAGAVVQAIVELMHRHCHSKETMALKEICSLIIRKPDVIGLMVLFHQPAYILGPLCSLLDVWKWDDIHGESQPVYDEFGGILLLILLFKFRFNLTADEVGVSGNNSFIRRLFETNSLSKTLDDLDEPTHRHLGEWIAAFFVVGHLSDDLTTSCSAQDFYLLVPTLFSQSLLAYECGKLSLEIIKSGLDYFLDPFLLPALVVAFSWLIQYIWECDGNPRANAAIQLLRHLTKSPTSADARAMHTTILAMVAEPAILVLETMTQTSPAADAKALIATFKPHIPFRRTDEASKAEIESWTATTGGLLGSFRKSFRSLLYWSTGLQPSDPPATSFTYKQINICIQLVGASDVLYALLDEVKILDGNPNYNAALDIAATAICAQSVVGTSASRKLTLRGALKTEHGNLANSLQKGDTTYAATVVRIYRQVETWSIIPPSPPDLPLDAAASGLGDLANIDLQSMNLDAAATDAGIDSGDLQGVGEAQPEDIDKMLNDAVNVGSMMDDTDFNANDLDVGESMDDIFAGLVDTVDLGNFDDLDMDGLF